MYDKYVKDIMDLYDKEQDEYDELEKKELPHEKEHEEEDKIAEKYDKLLLNLNKKYNIIFRYDLIDAWGVQLSTLIITSEEKDNVVCVYDNEGYKNELENFCFTIESNKILKILSKYEDGIKKVENMEDKKSIKVNDGVFNNFYFDINGNIYVYNIDNLLSRYTDMKEQAEMFSDLLTEIREVLVKEDKNIDRCLTLG